MIDVNISEYFSWKPEASGLSSICELKVDSFGHHPVILSDGFEFSQGGQRFGLCPVTTFGRRPVRIRYVYIVYMYSTYPPVFKYGNGTSSISRGFSHVKPPFIGDFPLLSKDWSVLHHLVREVSWISRNSRTISRIWKLGCGPGTRLNMPRTSSPKVLKISREIHLAWARLYPLYRSLSLFWVDLVYVENELVGAFDFVFPSEISIVPPNPPNR